MAFMRPTPALVAVRDAGRRPVPVRRRDASRRRGHGARRPQRGAARAPRPALAARPPAGAGGAAGLTLRRTRRAHVRRGACSSRWRRRPSGQAGGCPRRTSRASGRPPSRPVWPAGCTRASTAARAGRSSSGCWSRSSSAARPTRCRGTSRAPTTCSASGSAEQIDRYLRPALRGELHDAYAVTEAEAGSDPSRVATTAVRRDGGWVINGEKWFVTYGDVAAVYIVMARTDEGPTLFLVDRACDGISIVDDPPFTHSYPHGHPTIRFTDVRVGDDAVIGGVGEGDELQRAWFTEERLGIAARGVGAMWRLLEEATAWALSREQGGSRIMDYQGVSFPLADSAADAAAGRALDARGRAARRRGRGPEGRAREGVDGEAVRVRGGVPLRRPRRAGVRRPRLHAHRTSPSGSCASCASTASGRARARSSG